VLSVLLVGLVGLLAVTRLLELRISRRHRRALLESGARPIEERGFLVMVSLHVAVLVGAIVEPLLTRRTVPVWLGVTAAAGVVGASLLRVLAIQSLGRHWNVRVIDSTALGVVTAGPYRYVRHPNYVAVFLELLLLPLVQGAWLTAALGSVLHAFVLRRRILLEEAVLLAHPEYRASMGGKPRFLPRLLRPAPALAQTEKS
jgi:methyltransferase